MPAEGGEARMVTNDPWGADSYLWPPDGKSIAYTAVTEDRGVEMPEGVSIYTRSDYNTDFTQSQIFVTVESLAFNDVSNQLFANRYKIIPFVE